jgi:hypothetical protein
MVMSAAPTSSTASRGTHWRMLPVLHPSQEVTTLPGLLHVRYWGVHPEVNAGGGQVFLLGPAYYLPATLQATALADGQRAVILAEWPA